MDRDTGPDTAPRGPKGGEPLVAVLPAGLRKLLDQSEDAVYVLDTRGRLRWANPATLRLLDAGDVAALDGRAFDDLWRRPAQRRNFLRLLAEEDAVEGFRRELRGLDGEVVTVRESRYAQRDRGGRLSGYVGLLTRLEDSERQRRVVPSLTRDFATGAYSKDCLERLDEDLGDRPCGCLVFEVSAARGELEPRDVRALSHLVTRLTRVEDLLMALAADRLALITSTATLPALKAIAERVAARVVQETRLRVTIGLAVRRSGEPIAELLERSRGNPHARVRSRHPGSPAARVSGPPPR